MGNSYAKIFTTLFGKEEIITLMVGLVGAGKTTILYKLKFGEIITTDSGVETVEYKNIKLKVLDLDGHGENRPVWRNYLQEIRAMLFVVDSNARESIGDSREELNRMLNEDELWDAVLLVFANKQDLPNAMNAAEITEK